jgi:calcium-dependent protein kinase
MAAMFEPLLLKRQWFITSKTAEINQEYILADEIGSGGYGKVYKAQHKESGVTRAVKIIQKDKVKDYNTFITELNILKNLDHPNIVNIIETFETLTLCYVVLEYCQGGELFERLCKYKTFSEQHAAQIMKSLISAVMYCHNNGICHRDLKPENCLFLNQNDDSDLKIIDFGLSVVVTEEEILHDMYGTPYYIAPEMLSGSYTKVVDCWSLGVIMYMLLSGTPPFNGVNNNEILRNVHSGEYTFRRKGFKKVSNSAKDLITRLLTKDPAYRITAQQAFMHPWIKDSSNNSGVLLSNPVSLLPQRILSSIDKFSKLGTFKRASFSYIASKLTDKDTEILRTVFKNLDINGDGVISVDEFTGLIQDKFSIDIKEVQDLCESLDTNKNGYIDYTEFLAGCLIRRSFDPDHWLKSAFDYFDSDKDGNISLEDLKQAFTGGELNIPISKSRIEVILKKVDNNSDGKIDFTEFASLMKDI